MTPALKSSIQPDANIVKLMAAFNGGCLFDVDLGENYGCFIMFTPGGVVIQKDVGVFPRAIPYNEITTEIRSEIIELIKEHGK